MSDSNPIVLYDGLCGFCDAGVQKILRRDTRGVLRFASLQSEAGEALLQRHSIDNDMSTMVLIEGGSAYLRSRAALRTLSRLGWPWRAVGWLRVLPAWLTDPFYRLVARNRYRIPFGGGRGRLGACRVPQPGQAERFLSSRADLERVEG
ncbi:MAG: putative DCC family thiol-disulfide oxidoreductase YuxK [Phycisphaerales bacterium]|jgi:predicted DCC family thiol-disulfide oxidoreductase YuxK